ncbi:hypothetical protein K2173_010263 [Erythroxylum novogranatense]|uniref:Uncharacterized protein n=1 Tax=Erythroxylum novogranatense TaxID=1862640 RepID=A0AAV8TEZ9_9ROSI|nr:hypothetical protein K2173_010263 [Erythroxylum novogranatense]
MGNRRFAQVSTSDEDEDDVPPPPPKTRSSTKSEGIERRRKRMKLQEDDEEEEEEEKERGIKAKKRARDEKKKREEPEVEEGNEEEEEEPPQEDAKPVGEPVRFSGKGRGRRRHYVAFEFDGNRYDLEDPVLLVPEDKTQKPYVAIIKDITQTNAGSMMVTGQWFYRPEEAAKKGGGSWQSRDTRELFYSFHRDEVPAESVMHKCLVHFVPIHKQLPNRKQHPGFIVQKVYDTVELKLWKLTDKDYETDKQHEIDLLVQKTLARLGDLPDIETEDTPYQEEQSKLKRTLRKRNISPLDISRDEEATTRTDNFRAETPGSCTSSGSEYHNILLKFEALTGDSHRDKWLERLLQCIQYMCNGPDDIDETKVKVGFDGSKSHGAANGSQEKDSKGGKSFTWPDAAVPAVSALEKASHDTLSSDFQKYNQKLRQLAFNLKNNPVLARRLLNRELEPSKILNMSPAELKEGLTAEETASKEPDDSERMQMTDARCTRCNEFKVGVRDIIQAGHGDRYQLECTACGNSWYASRDDAAMLTIDGPSATRSVGAAPWATAKFEEVEKVLVSPRETDKAAEVFKKISEPYIPVLEKQKSFSKSKNDENPENSPSSTFTLCTKNSTEGSHLILCFESTLLQCLVMVVVDMDSDFEKKCTSSLSPNTVLPQLPCSNIDKRNAHGKLARKNDVLRVKEGFTEISFRRYRSSSCKNVQSRPVGLETNIELKRGSVYQSSREARKMKKMANEEERTKIELSCASDNFFSFRIVDSLCSSDEENSDKISPLQSVNSILHLVRAQKPCLEPCLSDGFIEICPNLDERGKQSSTTIGSDSILNLNLVSEPVTGPTKDSNDLPERDTAQTFHKSLSAKVQMLHSCSPSESDSPYRTRSKSRLNPIKKMFDPFKKSKSLRSPLGYVPETSNLETTGMEYMRRNQTFRKSLLRDFSHTSQESVFNSQHVKKDSQHTAAACSPVHLHACLKLEDRHGVPFFEFSLDCPEEVLVAKTWKASNSFSWVYTFHSICNRKRSNATGCGLTDGNRESFVVGQMQVSCYFSSDLKDGRFCDNSMMTEFVLYDIEHARHNVSDQGSPDISKCPTGSNPRLVGKPCESKKESDEVKLKHQLKHGFVDGCFDSPIPYPCTSAILCPDLEIAAIVIQLPFAKRESLKYQRGDRRSDDMHSNILDFSMTKQMRKDLGDRECPEKVKVVIPHGNHGLPAEEHQGPSSLLDRWRTGGGCDCGGWDMACPLTVFGNSSIQCDEGEPLMDNLRPLELFVQGTKDNTPALSMTLIEEGQYAVDFHAQLSTLQAFSICVAILHGTEISSATGEPTVKQLTHCSSLKVLIQEEVKFLIEAIAEEKKFSKTMKEIQHPYVINPPFSPIARV